MWRAAFKQNCSGFERFLGARVPWDIVSAATPGYGRVPLQGTLRWGCGRGGTSGGEGAVPAASGRERRQQRAERGINLEYGAFAVFPCGVRPRAMVTPALPHGRTKSKVRRRPPFWMRGEAARGGQAPVPRTAAGVERICRASCAVGRSSEALQDSGVFRRGVTQGSRCATNPGLWKNVPSAHGWAGVVAGNGAGEGNMSVVHRDGPVAAVWT